MAIALLRSLDAAEKTAIELFKHALHVGCLPPGKLILSGRKYM